MSDRTKMNILRRRISKAEAIIIKAKAELQPLEVEDRKERMSLEDANKAVREAWGSLKVGVLPKVVAAATGLSNGRILRIKFWQEFWKERYNSDKVEEQRFISMSSYRNGPNTRHKDKSTDS